MKILDTTPITDSAQFPIKKGTLAFLQDMNTERFKAMMLGLIGPTYNPVNIYVIYGVVNTGVGSNYIISEGAIFYQGEIFLVSGTSFTVTGSDVPVLRIDVSNYTVDADPVTFTDHTTKNVHNVRVFTVSAGATGSGIGDYSTASFLNFVIPKQLNATGAGVSGTYPNLVFAGPNGLFPIRAAGRVHVGDIDPSTGTDVTITFPASIGTSSYVVAGGIISIGIIPREDIFVSHGVIGSTMTATGFVAHIQENSGLVQNIDYTYVVIQLPS